MTNFFVRLAPEQTRPEFVGTSPENVPLNELGALSSVNLFVGANNSRKSRLCRHLMSQSEVVTCNGACNALLHRLQVLFKEIAALSLPEYRLRRTHGPITPEIFVGPKDSAEMRYYAEHNGEASDLRLHPSYFVERLKPLLHVVGKPDKNKTNTIRSACHQIRSELGLMTAFPELAHRAKLYVGYYRMYHPTPIEAIPEEALSRMRAAMQILLNLSDLEFKIEPLKATYVPTLRGTTQVIAHGTASRIPDKSYEATIRHNYGLENNAVTIASGLDLYSTIKTYRNARKETRTRFEEFEEFLAKNFFADKAVDIVAIDGSPVIHVWVDESPDRELHHLGDGIQSLINLMFPVFMCDDGSWIFIEEPEVHLHPGFQTLFMRTLLHNETIRNKNLRIFITTHSNHLLDTSLLSPDVSIFTMTLQDKGDNSHSVLRQVEGGEVDILDCLGVSNSSVFLAQCSIWVEGICDRLLVGAYLDAYMKHLDEAMFTQDLHYGFLEYAGSNIRHYLLLEDDTSLTELRKIKASAIGNRVWVLADQDDVKKNEKQERHRTLGELSTNHFQYVTTGAREIENTIPWSVLKDFLVDELNLERSDIEGRRLDETSYREKKMGAFLQEHFAAELGSRKLVSEYGTLANRYKIKLAEFVYRRVQDGSLAYVTLIQNPEAKRLAESLHAFLKRNCKL